MAQDSSDPTGVATTYDKDPSTIRARDRKANAAIQLKESGASWDQIAEVLGYPTARAALVATERALEKELRSESKEFLVKMADKRLERLLSAVWKKAIDPTSPEQMVAVTKAREIIGDHRKLYGLDKPTEVAVYSPSQAEIEAWVAEHITTDAALEEDDIFDVDFTEEPPAIEAGA